jgi:glyoxylase-like metal-dependent hydrolase (beta-lactamase superfamily II)
MRRPFSILSLAVALGLGAIAWTFMPVRLTPVAPPEGALPAAAPPAGMSLSALPTSLIEARAAFAFRGGSPAEPRQFSQTAILVRHPRGDLLFDTGVGEHADAQFAATPWVMHTFSAQHLSVPAARQLRAGGYDPRTLAGIVPTHVHWDHIAALPEFPGVPLWLNDRERAFIDEGGEQTALIRSFGTLATHAYAFRPAPYLGFSRSFDVWGDGSVVLVEAPGHTPGSILAFITLPSGRRLALLGDLVWQTEGFALPAERPWLVRRRVDHDAAEVRAAIARVAGISVRYPEITLLPAHDARAMGKLPVFPARLD